MANQPATNWALDTAGLLGNYAVHGTPVSGAMQQQNDDRRGMLGRIRTLTKWRRTSATMGEGVCGLARAGQCSTRSAVTAMPLGKSRSVERFQQQRPRVRGPARLHDVEPGTTAITRTGVRRRMRLLTARRGLNFGVQNGAARAVGRWTRKQPYTQTRTISLLSPPFRAADEQHAEHPNAEQLDGRGL